MSVTTPAAHPAALAFVGRQHGLLIDGAWVQPGGDVNIEVENPATGEIIATIASANAADVDAAIAAARAAFEGPWLRTPPNERQRILMRFADLVEANADELGDIETLENGMPRMIAAATIRTFCVEFIRYYAGWCNKITGDTLPATPIREGANDWLVYTTKEPIGVVGAIIPWNAPAAMLVLKIAPALATGCTLVLKPAELTPLLAIRFAELLQEAGLPPGVFNLVQGHGHDVGAMLASHPGLDKIAFTGSTAVGKAIVRAAADDLKRVTLELGGKSPFIVFADADLAQAIPAAAAACFFLSGQNCMAGTRLFVEESIHDAFMGGLAQALSFFKTGNGLEPDTIIGPLISARQRERVLGFIATAQREGATLFAQGEVPEGPGYFVPPTIFTDVKPGMQIAREEVFGPVLAVQKFKSDDEAGLLAVINGTPYGLSGSVWTKDLVRAVRLARGIDSGQVGINVHAAVSPETPFGGNKQSGWGREFGREGLEPYLKTKAVSINLGIR